MNLIFKKFQEYNFQSDISVGGKWNISIMRENGSERFPFGKEMKKNLILNQGLDILASNKYYTSYAGLNWNTIPAFLLGDAVNGGDSGATNVNPNDTIIANFLQSTSKVIASSCYITDDNINGSRTFSKAYDFPKPSQAQISVKEIGIRTRFGSEIDGENKLFSKFILPQNVLIARDEWIRLYYDFTIKSDAIINPINITRSSGTINANGKLKLCGRYDDVFGTFDSNGNPFIRFGDSPQAVFMPYCEDFCVETSTCQSKCVGTGYLISSIFIPTSPNGQIISEWVGERLSADNNTLIAPAYNNGDFYRDITYIFKKQNPIQNKEFEAFLFTSRKSDRNNTIAGWLWEFNNKQIKLVEKEIVIEIRQSMSRIDVPDYIMVDI